MVGYGTVLFMLRLRLATMDDWARLLAWRNDPETRAQFREQEVVQAKDHLAWLKKTLADPSVRLYVADDNEQGGSIATARLDLVKRKTEEWAECSVTVEPLARGKGYAAQVIARLVAAAQEWPVAGLIANVKPTNYASLRAFARCGFQPVKFGEEYITMERVAFVEISSRLFMQEHQR